MIAVFKTFLFQIVSIILFSLLYWKNSDGFVSGVTKLNKNNISYIDFLFTAVTIQAGVGYSDLFPVQKLTKALVILQQFIMISSNILILYLFSLHLLGKK